jgi:hypothetical protein
VYFGLITISAALVLAPGTPLGLLTNAVQTLAGVLLPSATVFLLLLCNDKAVLGPWVNSMKTTVFTGAVIAVLVMLSVILTASVMFPNISEGHILAVLIGGSVLGLGATVALMLIQRGRGQRGPGAAPAPSLPATSVDRDSWRMPPLHALPPVRLTLLSRTWLIVLRGYLIIAAGLVLVRIAELIV